MRRRKRSRSASYRECSYLRQRSIVVSGLNPTRVRFRSSSAYRGLARHDYTSQCPSLRSWWGPTSPPSAVASSRSASRSMLSLCERQARPVTLTVTLMFADMLSEERRSVISRSSSPAPLRQGSTFQSLLRMIIDPAYMGSWGIQRNFSRTWPYYSNSWSVLQCDGVSLCCGLINSGQFASVAFASQLANRSPPSIDTRL